MNRGGSYPVTPDGRYLVVRGRLWRRANPALSSAETEARVSELMSARRAVGQAKRAGDVVAEAEARRAVDVAKRALGERGPPWWTDGAPDFNRRLARTTPYASWFAELPAPQDAPAAAVDGDRPEPIEAPAITVSRRAS